MRKTLAIAESCTGGYLSHLVTSVPGSSNYFKGGVVAYSNEVKRSILNVPRSLLAAQGAVSASVARRMAQSVRKLIEADIGIGVSGIAGPTGGTKQKPVGLVYIALADGRRTFVTKNLFRGKRPDIIAAASRKALEFLERFTATSSKPEE